MTEQVLARTDQIEISSDAAGSEPQLVDGELVRRVAEETARFPGLPMQIIEKYAEIASQRYSVLKRLPDGTWFAEIPGFAGVWANEDSRQEVLGSLEEVLLEWIVLKIEHKDRDLPVVEEIDLNVL